MGKSVQIILTTILVIASLFLLIYYLIIGIRLSRDYYKNRKRGRFLSMLVMFGTWVSLILIWAIWDEQARASLDILFVIAVFLGFISGIDTGIYNFFRKNKRKH